MYLQILGDKGVWSGGFGVVTTHALANIETIDQSLKMVGHIGAIAVSCLWIYYIWKKIRKLQDEDDGKN